MNQLVETKEKKSPLTFWDRVFFPCHQRPYGPVDEGVDVKVLPGVKLGRVVLLMVQKSQTEKIL